MSSADLRPGDRIVRVGDPDTGRADIFPKTKGTVRQIKHLGQSVGVATDAYVLLCVEWDRELPALISGRWIAVHDVRKISALEELAETYEE